MKITPEMVGRELGVTAATVRQMMDDGELKIGRIAGSDKRKSYVIFPKLLYEETGIKLGGYEPVAEVNYTKLADAMFQTMIKAFKEVS
jgi:hypothetical protein